MASDDAKFASPPAAADPPAADAEDAAPADAKEETTPQQPEKKRGRRKKGEAQAEAAKKTPTPRKSGPAAERPSRERKTVERYSELAPRVTPVKKSPAILQGSGTKLKDIPNVSFKLSKRKADDILQSLHVLMYGKKSNVHFLKRNISQFSGFVWTDNQEKHRTKIKEKLDKFNKEKLLDFCEILDISVAKATTKKEEVSAKVLEFLESPFITRDVVLTDNKKGKKRGRRPKGSGEATSEGASEEKKRKRGKKQAAEAGKENDDEEDAGSKDTSTGEEGDEESEANDHAVSDDEPDEPPAKKRSTDVNQVKKETGSNAKEKDTPRKRVSTKPVKGASKPSQDIKDEPDIEVKKAGKRAKSSKETDAPQDSNKVNKVPKSKKVDGKESQNNKVAKTSSKNKGKGKGGAEAKPVPTIEQLHAVVTRILKEVDFNTATLADILRQLGTHFEVDLMDRKAEVKCIIEDVINNMSDDDGGEEDSEDEAEDNGKEEKVKSDPDGGEEK
ncbi:protein DEK-like isoform X2 [Panicum virgatum]|uniref:DEK-C domain-containing protein n=1 Tax=Panicum virgatum TaxID=38727 RepID=A0A8T0S9Z5_PANVG|nr:protein DEK-like isoform X2 [Panicum virgatum]KAG2593965.1 hypothetical protein PVAP13_5NG265000 [Panicum virgatum]